MALPSVAGDGCVPPQFVTPRPGQVGGVARPLIVAKHGADLSVPRLLADVRIPEGEILRRLDIQMSAEALLLPVTEPVYRANVILKLIATCQGAGAKAPRETSVRTYIDTGLNCPVPMKVSQAGGQLAWIRPSGSEKTEVALFGVDGGREVRRLTTEASALKVDRSPSGDTVAALRSRCGLGYSAPVFVYLD